MKTTTIVITTLVLIILYIIMIWLPNYVPETDKEKADCLKETGNIYCNGPRGD